ncbi:MAG: acyloxyacyl hydrolase [Bacteroidales bacterium]|nr:acyloxyacyl hydrolase [Bacteroidales bacterium]
MMRLRLCIVCLLFWALSAPAVAQNITFKAGASKLLYDKRYYHAIFGEGVAPVIPSVGVNLGWRDYSDSPYAFICNHPEYGIALQFDGLADAVSVDGPGLGNVYCLYGYFDRAFVQTKRVRMGYYGGFGFANCFSKLYDPVTNPKNLIFSTMLNSRIKFGLQAQYQFSNRYFAGIGFYFNHSSNGAVNFPNRGYNAYELTLSLGMRDKEELAKPLPERRDDGFRRKFQFDVQVSAGVMSNEEYFDYREKSGLGGDNMYFPKYSFDADVLYKYCRTHATGIGFDLFVTPFCSEIAKYLYMYRRLDNPEATEEHFEPVSFGISIVHEMCYRNLTVTAGVGRYLYDNDGLARNKILYQLVNIKYHFPDFADTYAGIVLKAHKFMAAESIQLCIGKRF